MLAIPFLVVVFFVGINTPTVEASHDNSGFYDSYNGGSGTSYYDSFNGGSGTSYYDSFNGGYDNTGYYDSFNGGRGYSDTYSNYGSTWGGWDTYSGLDSYGYGGYGSGYGNYGSSYGSNYGSNCPGGYGYYPCCDFSQYCPGYDTTTYVVTPGPITQEQITRVIVNNTGSQNPNPQPVPAPTVTISANPSVVDQGGSTTLTWSSQNAVSCTASGSWTGSKNVSGSEVRGSIWNTQTYIITCYNSQGASATAQTSVTVRAPQPITVDLSANPNVVDYNGQSVLSWTSQNANYCVASNDWFGTKTPSGSEVRSNLTSNRTYTITCYNDQNQSATDTVTVAVRQQNLPISVDLTADQMYVNYGGSTVLRWTSQNADSCTASGDWFGQKSTFGQQSTGALYRTSTFYITCFNNSTGQSASDSVVVQVQGANPGITTTVTTLPADPGTYSCTFYGSVSNSSPRDTSAWFEYGSSTNLGNQTPHGSLGSISQSNFNRTVSGLSANTRYFYRAVAQTDSGVAYGAILSCITGSIVNLPTPGNSSASIEKSVSNTTRPSSGTVVEAFPGDQLRYTIVVRNTGDRTLTNLEVTDRLSSFVDYRSGGDYNRNNRTVAWTISRLGVGESKTLTLDVTAGVCATETTVENTATVDNAQISARTSNKVIVNLRANGTGYGYPQASGPLAVTIDTDRTSVSRGENVTMRVALRNQSSGAMTDGVVRVTLPSNLEFRNADRQSQVNGNTITFMTGVLAPAGIDEIRVAVTVKNGAAVGERLPVSADAIYRDQSGASMSGRGEIALTVSDANGASVLGSDGFFPNSLVGWLLILLLLIVIILLLKRALKKEYDGKPANA